MHPRDIPIDDFAYDLPEERIAQHPLAERGGSRLLVRREGVIRDHRFQDLPGLLPPDALLVLNETRVVNARLLFRNATGARIEVLCLEPADGGPVERAFAARGACEWHALVGNAKKWKRGETLLHPGTAGPGAHGTLRAERIADRVRFMWEPANLPFAEVLERVGHVPLPPYIKRPDAAMDKDRYNTVFARHQGSVAAPTASLHFTPGVLRGLRARGIATTGLTLHVGAGTFLPVKSARMSGHAMHREQVRVPLSALEAIAARLGRAPIVAVGTTALRTLESVYWHGARLLGCSGDAVVERGAGMDIGQWEPYGRPDGDLPGAAEALDAVIAWVRADGMGELAGSTRLLIAPGYGFRFADALVTNFHQPRSTLLLLVAAFVGPAWREVYDHALEGGYRFLSYGDGSLLWRDR